MSFLNPLKAIPLNIYSIKATFITERENNGSSIADKYILNIREAGESNSWIKYTFESETFYCFIGELKPYTQYETKWELQKENSTNSYSDSYFFNTRATERFPLRPEIPTPLYGEDFPNALQNELDSHIDYINTMDDEKSIERFLKEGSGRITGCQLKLPNTKGKNLSILKGWFQSGAGFDKNDTKKGYLWFPGARLFQIANEKEIIDEESDVLNSNGIFYGYAGSYEDENGAFVLDIEWLSFPENTLPSSPSNGKWIIGKIEVESGVIISANSEPPHATEIPTLLNLQAKISSLTLGGSAGGGSSGSSGGPEDASKLKFDPTDISIPPESTFDAVRRENKQLKSYVDGKFKALQPGKETSMEFIVGQFARECVNSGQNNPAGLLRIDGAFVLPKQYGDGSEVELNGEVVSSPTFVGEGNLNYNEESMLWEV